MKVAIERMPPLEFDEWRYRRFDMPAVPRVGDHVEVDENDYVVEVVIWCPQSDEEDAWVQVRF